MLVVFTTTQVKETQLCIIDFIYDSVSNVAFLLHWCAEHVPLSLERCPVGISDVPFSV